MSVQFNAQGAQKVTAASTAATEGHLKMTEEDNGVVVSKDFADRDTALTTQAVAKDAFVGHLYRGYS